MIGCVTISKLKFVCFFVCSGIDCGLPNGNYVIGLWSKQQSFLTMLHFRLKLKIAGQQCSQMYQFDQLVASVSPSSSSFTHFSSASPSLPVDMDHLQDYCAAACVVANKSHVIFEPPRESV